MRLIPGWLRRKPRRLDPVACSECGCMPRVWQDDTGPQWFVACFACMKRDFSVLRHSVRSHMSRNDAIRRWNNMHGDVVFDQEAHD